MSLPVFKSKDESVTCVYSSICLFWDEWTTSHTHCERSTTRWQHHSKLHCHSSIHTHTFTLRSMHTHTFTSDNKDACRCFYDSELLHAAYALQETLKWRWCCSFVGDCMCSALSERQRERGERERAAVSQGLFTPAGGLCEILFPPLSLDFIQLVQFPVPFRTQRASWTLISSHIIIVGLPIWRGSH